MALALRPSIPLADKTNVNPSINRQTEVTAEDFTELAFILNSYADRFDALLQPALFYYFHTSLAVLQATYPNAEENGWAVIVPTNGNQQFIATFSAGVWTATAVVAPIQLFNTKLDRPDPGAEGIFYVIKDEKILSLWYDGSYHPFGKDGNNGINAYEVAVAFGFVGTEPEWIASLEGKSAYQSAIDTGFVGTEADWIASVQGVAGKSAYQVALDDGFVGTEAEWLLSLEGAPGDPGISAYEVAVADGFVGTEADWLLSLEGAPGDPGISAYEVAVANGFVGTEADWLLSLEGSSGDSAYQVWLNQGNTGTEQDFIDSLKGATGNWKENEYATITELLANQAGQNVGKLQHVLDATIDATVTTGWATYELLGAKTAALGDYRKLSEKESMDVAASGGADLTGELQFPAYPNTRDDGAIPTNRILSTDANGNLKLYRTATAPAPFLDEVIPDSYLPSTTGNFILNGAFFTPTMCLAANLNNSNGILIQGQVVNYATFKSDNQIICNITTGATEGLFDITLNNGLSTTFSDVLLLVLGDVFQPKFAEWESIVNEPGLDTVGQLTLVNKNLTSNATWSQIIDTTKNIRIQFTLGLSPLVPSGWSTIYYPLLKLEDTVTGDKYEFGGRIDGVKARNRVTKNGVEISLSYTAFRNLFLEYDGTTIFMNKGYSEETSRAILETITLSTNPWKITAYVEKFDILKIKYIELAP